jgi:hypothetical protein
MKNMATLDTVKNTLNMKVWGEHSLTIGSILGLIVGGAIIYFKPLGGWSIWVGLIVIAVSIAIF